MSGGMNALGLEEHIYLDVERGEKKIIFSKDTKMMNAGKFFLYKEDHTLGNMLRMELLRDPRIVFAGYRMPHPLEFKVDIQVRGAQLLDGSPEVTPVQAMKDSITALKSELRSIDGQFQDQVRRFSPDAMQM